MTSLNSTTNYLLSSAKPLSIKQAAELLQVGEQAVREMIKAGCIPGACAFGSKKHLRYYITDSQIQSFMKGGFNNGI